MEVTRTRRNSASASTAEQVRLLRERLADRSTVGVLELLFDPLFDVGPPVAEVFADPESGWPFPAVPPLVEGGDRYAQVVGEFPHVDQPVLTVHTAICGSLPN